jgi:hypothetical protein
MCRFRPPNHLGSKASEMIAAERSVMLAEFVEER